MKLNNKGFAFSTMLYGTLAVITVVLYAILTISKETVDETYYYGTDIEKKLNECIQDEIEMEKCYTNNQNSECNTASYHACLGISDNTSTNNGMLAAEKLKQIANSGEENLSIIQDPYTEKRYIYVGIDGNGKVVNNYIEYANKVWRIISVEPNGTLKLLDYTTYQSSQWDTNGNDSWGNSSLNSYLNKKYFLQLTNTTKIVKSAWFTFFIHSSDNNPTIQEIINSQMDNNNNQNGAITFDKTVGLLSTVDYIKATQNNSCHSSPLTENSCISWLSSYRGWTTDIDGDNHDTTMVYYFGEENKLQLANATDTIGFYPVIYLDRNSTIIGGTGTSSDPYIIK